MDRLLKQGSAILNHLLVRSKWSNHLWCMQNVETCSLLINISTCLFLELFLKQIKMIGTGIRSTKSLE